MVKQCLISKGCWLLAGVSALSLAAGLMGDVPAAEPDSAALETFAAPDGTTYFALALKAEPAAPAPARDVVVLFDTSASQAGPFRQKAREALRGLAAGLGRNDRLHLMACDLRAVPLSEGFVSPVGPAMEAALAKLDARVPLGSTDMEKALQSAVEAFDPNSNNGRVLVYIGDGISRANLLESRQFGELVSRLVAQRIAVVSYAIGPEVESQLLGALAGRTGGVVIMDQAQLDGRQAGAKAAAAALAPVSWPVQVDWPAALAEVYPQSPPPLRPDRDSVVVGVLKDQAAGPLQFQMTLQSPAGVQQRALSAAPKTSAPQNAYLAEVVRRARVDGGVSLPLVGSESLADARQLVNMGAFNLAELAREALAADNLDAAERLAAEALKSNPQDALAKRVQQEVAQRRAGGGEAAGSGAFLPGAVGEPAAGDLTLIGPGAGGAFEAPGAFAQAFQRDRSLIRQVVQTEVIDTINQARHQMGTDPEGAAQNLKLKLEHVRQAAELDPAVRDQLIDQLQAAVREAERRQVQVEQERQRAYERIAAAKERQIQTENLLRDQEKLRQLMERFNSLMDEGRYRLAEEAAAVEAQAMAPDNPVPMLATLHSRTVGYYHDAMALRVARQKAVVDTLYQVEKSHVPFADEPPIVYPPAEVWQEITARRVPRYRSMDVAQDNPAEKRIEEALRSPTEVEFPGVPLSEVINYLEDLHGIEIELDEKALQDAMVDADRELVTKSLKGISLRSALRLILRDLNLTYMIKDEVLLITTPEKTEQYLTTKVYPVADLVLPIRNPSFAGGFGTLGGWGGAGTSMYGGIGLGGWGGVGGIGGLGTGGWGGIGGVGGLGGFGGTGMFNIPPGILPAEIPPGGFQAFAVAPEDLSQPPQPAAPEPQPATVAPVSVAPAAERPQTIDLAAFESAEPNQAWDRYFASHEPTEAAVREAVRRLMNSKQYDQVIGLTQAALRHGQAQSWMYEVMALAMQAAERPAEEIERAVMSAADFAQGPEDLMYLGLYLTRLGMHARALDIFRETSQLIPLRPEPYVLGLEAAQRIDNLEGIQWATLGILRQAWTADQAHVWQRGLHAARATLERLKAEKRLAEAAAFEKALDEAVRRDVVVCVSWTGDADVDLMVEEPSGTLCSLRTPRTTAGGVMLGDSFSHLADNTAEGYSEYYVCPEAFDGTYRVLVRRVWGKVTGGKVNVEVIHHYRSPNAVVVRKRIPLENDQALVAFDLEGGRRKESLQGHQIANTARTQLAVGRQVLAQQLAGAIDPAAMQSLAGSRARVSNSSMSFWPFVSGAVGYQPVIVTLPEGANLAATAVISADRRYVRVTVLPTFSGISEVNIFNMATGENFQGRGGTGGQGYGDLFGPGGGGGGGFNGGVGVF